MEKTAISQAEFLKLNIRGSIFAAAILLFHQMNHSLQLVKKLYTDFLAKRLRSPA
jgi:hypothetical protein